MIDLTEKERLMAVADGRYRVEAGYDDAFRARAKGELAAIGKDLESFEASRVEFEEIQKFWISF